MGFRGRLCQFACEFGHVHQSASNPVHASWHAAHLRRLSGLSSRRCLQNLIIFWRRFRQNRQENEVHRAPASPAARFFPGCMPWSVICAYIYRDNPVRQAFSDGAFLTPPTGPPGQTREQNIAAASTLVPEGHKNKNRASCFLDIPSLFLLLKTTRYARNNCEILQTTA